MPYGKLLIIAVAALAFPSEAATLKRGTNAEPRSLDPQLGLGNSAGMILNDLFEGLLTVGPDGKPVPGVAESWSAGADGQSYTFTLRPGLTWSDGHPLAAEDFVFSFRRLLDPAIAATFASFLYPIAGARDVNAGRAGPETLGVRAVDPRTLEVRLAFRAPYFPDIMTANAAAPVPGHLIERHGARWTEPGIMVSNGAYVLSARVPQTSITAMRNPKYRDAAAVKIDAVVYYPSDDQGAALKRFRAGELDIALNFPAEQIALIERELPGTLRVGPTLGVFYIMLNQARPPLDDRRVRRALSLAIDRDGIVAKLLPPGATPAIGLVPPTISNFAHFSNRDHEEPLDARQKRARALLTEAGYGANRPLTFSFKFDTLEQNRRIGTAVIAMWKAIGVVATPDAGGAQAVDRDARTRNYDTVRWTWFAPYDDATSFLGLLEGGESTNRSTFVDAEFDQLMNLARKTGDPAARRSFLEQAERRAFDLQAVIPIYYPSNRRLVQTYVRGWQENPRAVNLTRYLWLER